MRFIWSSRIIKVYLCSMLAIGCQIISCSKDSGEKDARDYKYTIPSTYKAVPIKISNADDDSVIATGDNVYYAFDSNARTAFFSDSKKVIKYTFKHSMGIVAVGVFGANGKVSVYGDKDSLNAGKSIAVFNGNGEDNWRTAECSVSSDSIYLEFDINSGAGEVEFYCSSDGNDGNGGAAYDTRVIVDTESLESYEVIQNNLVKVNAIKAGTTKAGFAGRVSVTLDVDPIVYKRCFIVYGGSLRSPADAEFEINESNKIKGDTSFSSTIAVSGKKFFEEIPVSILHTGENTIDFKTITSGTSIDISKVGIIFEGETGWNMIKDIMVGSDSVYALDNYSADMSRDIVSAYFETISSVTSLSVLKVGASYGTLKLEYQAEDGWVDSGYTIDVSKLGDGWNKIENLPEINASSIRISGVNECKDVKILGIRTGLHILGNPLEKPEISVSWPRKGEYCGNNAFVRGCIRGRTALSSFTADDSVKDVDADGLYSVLVPKSTVADNSWLVRLNAFRQSNIVGKRDVRFTDDLVSQDDGGSSGEGSTNDENGGSSDSVTSKGASFTVSSGESRTFSYNNVLVSIPAGAVSDDTVITIIPLTESDVKKLNMGMVNITTPDAGYRFLFNGKPHGKFNKPIQITIGFNPSLLLPGQTEGDVNMYYFDEETASWRRIDKVESAVLKTQGKRAASSSLIPTGSRQICARTDHFTDYINATIAMPDHPETNAFNPNTMKDIKAADPSANINLMEPPSANMNGDAAVQYPIEIPKGINGVQPSVALSYNSSASATWCGYGWDVDVSSISIDTKWGTPKYSDTPVPDTYVMDGQTLVPEIRGNAIYKSSTERYYRPRVEGAFSRIVRNGTSGAYSWIVTSRNGTKYYYGSTPESRLQSAGKIAQWKLDKMEDINGNCVTYKYKTYTTQYGISLYLQWINYSNGKYSIEFVNSELERDDKRMNTRFGFKTVSDRILSMIAVRYNGNMVRKYDLVYSTGAYGHKILTELKQSAVNGTDKHFYSHKFEYNDADASVEGQFEETATSWGNGEIGRSKSISEDVNASLTVSPFTCMKYLSYGAGAGANSSDTETMETMLDMDGDGLPDLVRKTDTGIVYYKNLSRTEGKENEFGSKTEVSNLSSMLFPTDSSEGWFWKAEVVGTAYIRSKTKITGGSYFNDINGDGLVDLCTVSGVMYNSLNNGTPTFKPSSPVVFNDGASETTDEEPYDGLDDVSNEQLKESYYRDIPLRIWKAPRTGTVNIGGSIKRVGIAPKKYTTFDSVRTSIWKCRPNLNGGGTQEFLWERVFGNDQTTDYVEQSVVSDDLVGVQVIKGDLIVFMTDSGLDGKNDIVKWISDIKYTDVNPIEAIAADENGLPKNKFNSKDDFSIVGSYNIMSLDEGISDAKNPKNRTLHVKVEKLRNISDDVKIECYVRKVTTKVTGNAGDDTVDYIPLNAGGFWSDGITVSHKNEEDPIGKTVSRDYTISSEYMSSSNCTYGEDQKVSGTSVSYFLDCRVYSLSPIDYTAVKTDIKLESEEEEVVETDGKIEPKKVTKMRSVPVNYRNFVNTSGAGYATKRVIREDRPPFGFDLPKKYNAIFKIGRRWSTVEHGQAGISHELIGIPDDFVANIYVSLKYRPLGSNEPAKSMGTQMVRINDGKIESSMDGAGHEGGFIDSIKDFLVDLFGKFAHSTLGYYTVHGLKELAGFGDIDWNYDDKTSIDLTYFENKARGEFPNPEENEFFVSIATEMPNQIHRKNTQGQETEDIYEVEELFNIEGLFVYSADTDGNSRWVQTVTDDNGNKKQVACSIFSSSGVNYPGGDAYKVTTPSTIYAGGHHSWYFARTNGEVSNNNKGWCELSCQNIRAVDKIPYKNRNMADYAKDCQTVVRNFSPACGKTVSQLSDPSSVIDDDTSNVEAKNNVEYEEWIGNCNESWISAEYVSASRMVMPYVQEFAPGFTTSPTSSSSSGRTCTMSTITKSNSVGWSLFSYTRSTARTNRLMIDLNGDRYSDIVKVGKAQVSNPDGALADSIDALGHPRYSESKIKALNITIPSSLMIPQYDSAGDTSGSKQNDSSSSAGGPFGSAGAGVTEGDNRITEEYVDMNGDGLPDKAKTEEEGNVEVSLNMGGTSFAAWEDWCGGPGVTEGSLDSETLSVSGGYSGDAGSFSAGVSISESSSVQEKSFQDMNGDGLVDLVYQTGSEFRVKYNTGTGFSPAKSIAALKDLDGSNKEETKSWTGNGNGTLKIPIQPIFLIATLHFTAGLAVGKSESHTRTTFTDMNGDGFADAVENSGGEIKVRLNKGGKINLLKKIRRPLGGTIEIGYERAGNTQKMPEGKWVMSKVTVHDGTSTNESGKDIHGSVRTYSSTFEYANGEYNREERESYGFATVKETKSDGTTIEKTYVNDSVHTKGLEKKVTVSRGSEKISETTSEYTPYECSNNVKRTDEPLTNDDFNTMYSGCKVGYRMTSRWMKLVRRTMKEYDNGGSITTAEEFGYDNYGNVTAYSETESGALRVRANIRYITNSERNILDRPEMIAVTGADGKVYRERKAVYDSKLRLAEITEVSGGRTNSTSSFTYDGYGNLKTFTGPENHRGQRRTVEYTYDDVVHTYIEKVTDRAYNIESTMKYDYTNGNVLLIQDMNGYMMRYSYDEFGRVVNVYAPDKSSPVIISSYDIGSFPAKAYTTSYSDKDESQSMQTVTFIDGLKRMEQIKKSGTVNGTDCMIASGAVIYDEAGRAVEQGEPFKSSGTDYAYKMENPTTIEYDTRGRKIHVENPDGTDTEFSYAVNGNTRVTRVTDAEGHVKTSYADAKGNITRIEEPNNITTSYEYDAMNQITKITDSKGNVTTCAYDKAGRRISTTNPDTGTITYTYDGAGNLITKTTPNTDKKGGAINYVYDNSRLITVTYKDASPVKYTYGNTGDDANGAGRIVKTETANCTDEYRYDWMGNVVWNKRTIKSLDGEVTSYVSNYKYDYFGRMKMMTLPDKKTTTYGYDKGGQLAAVSGSDTRYVSGIKYNATGQRTAETSGDGTTTTYDYNPENHRLKTLETKRKGTTVQNISYKYDDVGNITERTSEMMGSDNRMKKTTHEYTYDDNDRLTEGEGSVKGSGLLRPTIVSYKSSYTYNAIGNILHKNQSVNGGESSLSGNDTYEYGAKQPHAVTKAGSMVFTYDDNGNMVTRENTNTKNTMTLVWDDENRLVQTKDNFHKTDYRYDASGERIIKKSELGETQYISANYIVRNKTVVSTHIFAGNQRIASTVGIKDSCGNVTEQNTLYYHPDHLGSSSYVTNQSGEFYEMIEYLPYGETLYDEQTVSSVSYKYTGKEQDTETGLYYYGARYYDAKLCKFITPDDRIDGLFTGAGQNMYMYCHGNPIRFNDPDGHRKEGKIAGAYLGSMMGPIGAIGGAYLGDKIQNKFFSGGKKGKSGGGHPAANSGGGQNAQNVVAPVGGTPGKVRLNSPWPTRASSSGNHPGADLGGSPASQVFAMQGGTVTANVQGDGYNVGGVFLKNGNIETRYQHVSGLSNLHVGDVVQTGQLLGVLDNSGKEAGLWDGWHLHFQVEKDGQNSNPFEFIMNVQPNLIWRFNDADNKNYMMNHYPNIYNNMLKE